jgi:uncharacterized membrane protein
MGRAYSFRSTLSKQDIDELISSNRTRKQQINNNFLAMAVLLPVIMLSKILQQYLGYQIITYLALLLFIIVFYLIIKTGYLTKKVDKDETTLTNLMDQEKRLEMVTELREPRNKIFLAILAIPVGFTLPIIYHLLVKMINCILY